MFKAFWPEVRGNYFFRNRRAYMDFLKSGDGKIFYLPEESHGIPPFALIGNWRDRSDITALWYLRGVGEAKKILVIEAARECFDEGAERIISKLLSDYEAAEYRQWGFKKACRIVLFEKRCGSKPQTRPRPQGVSISRYKKSMLEDVLYVDSASFDDFWKLDVRTLEAIADSCRRNIFLVASKDNRIVGYSIAGINGPLGYLQRLGVERQSQGMGIGSCLSSTILKMLYDMGATVVMVNTQENNKDAIGLYEKLGFRELQDQRYIMELRAADCEWAQ
jgi:ribosomal protein S18 acetylase RimI-like enzyme